MIKKLNIINLEVILLNYPKDLLINKNNKSIEILLDLKNTKYWIKLRSQFIKKRIRRNLRNFEPEIIQ